MKILREIHVPQESVNDDSASVIRVAFTQGSKVRADDVVIELETSKVNISLEAGFDGYVHYTCQEGDEVNVNAVIAFISDAVSQAVPIAAAPPREQLLDSPSTPQLPPYTGVTSFSAKASQLLDKYGISRGVFEGRDLISAADVLAYLHPVPEAPKTQTRQNLAPPVRVDEGSVTRKGISKAKKREIDYLHQVQQAGLNSLISIEVDIAGLCAAVGRHLKYFKDSLLPVIIYETSRLLLKYPVLNSFFSENEILSYNHVNIGVAIDVDDGLKTVCLRNANTLDMAALEELLLALSGKYLDKKLTPFDLTDITFTITDLSAEGIHFFSPLINRQNAAILGVSVPKSDDRMALCVTFDHRVTEGKTVSGFLRELKERLESYKNRLAETDTDIQCLLCRKKIRDDFSDFGFMKVTTKKGEEKHLCQSCFKGL